MLNCLFGLSGYVTGNRDVTHSVTQLHQYLSLSRSEQFLGYSIRLLKRSNNLCLALSKEVCKNGL